MPFPTTVALAAALLAQATALQDLAVSVPQQRQPPALPQEPQLGDTPFRVDGLGLAMLLPAGAVARVEPLADRLSAVMVDGAPVPAWSMRVQPMRSTLPDPTPDAQIDHLMASWTGEGRTFRVLHRRAVDIDGRASTFAVFGEEYPGDDGVPTEVATGWLVVPVTESDFLVFVINTLPETLASTLADLNASFATIELAPVSEITALREARLAAGADLLASATPERLRALVGATELLRMHRVLPDGGGEVEIGWMRIEFREGPRGALTPARAEADYTAREREIGLLVVVQGRAVTNAERRIFLDTEARYWMAWDQSEEEWSVRGTHRQGRAERSEAETGIRAPRSLSDPRGRLSVFPRTVTGVSKDDMQWAVPDVYLSQPLRWALGRLLPREPAQERVFAWYAYDGRSSSLPMRLDRWEPATGDNWILRSQPRDNDPETLTIYGGDGAIVRRITADGVISEPIELEELRRRWRAAGLETN